MKKNMGRRDRSLRLVAAGVFAVLLVSGIVKGTLAVILAIVAAIFVITSFVSVCPAYVPFGISTIGKSKRDEACKL